MRRGRGWGVGEDEDWGRTRRRGGEEGLGSSTGGGREVEDNHMLKAKEMQIKNKERMKS